MAGTCGARPPKPEDNGRRTRPADSQRGMAGVIPRRLEEDVRRARPDDSDMDSPPENKKDLASCQIFPVSIF